MSGEVRAIRLIPVPNAIGGEAHFVEHQFVGFKAAVLKSPAGEEVAVTHILTTSPVPIIVPGPIAAVAPAILAEMEKPAPPTLYLP